MSSGQDVAIVDLDAVCGNYGLLWSTYTSHILKFGNTCHIIILSPVRD